MREDTIIAYGDLPTARLLTIKQTVKIFKDFMEKHAPKKPTCNQDLYVSDVEFLLKLVEDKIKVEK